MSSPILPETIELGEAGISIVWKGGHRSIYPYRFLRLRCPCAHCIDEWTRAPRLDPDTVPADVQAVDHMLVGNYAVQFLWSDIHETGIYTYSFLRSVCTCMECSSKRDTSEAENASGEPV